LTGRRARRSYGIAAAWPLGALDAQRVELALDVSEAQISPPRHDADITTIHRGSGFKQCLRKVTALPD
jgi:hypothetical protein